METKSVRPPVEELPHASRPTPRIGAITSGDPLVPSNREPRELLRAASSRWYRAETRRLSNFSNAEEHVRSRVAHATTFARGYPEHGGQFTQLLSQILAYAERMTIEEQKAVEAFITENPAAACLTMQLALG